MLTSNRRQALGERLKVKNMVVWTCGFGAIHSILFRILSASERDVMRTLEDEMGSVNLGK